MKEEENQYKNFVPINDKGQLEKEKKNFSENIKKVKNRKIPMFRNKRNHPTTASISI